MRTISLSSNGSLFTIEKGVTLVLDSNITLQGRSGNNGSLVIVNTGGAFIMRDGTKISGNAVSNYNGDGGGVYVGGGTFTMNGGEISGNTASASYYTWSSRGGGVFVGGSGTFTMSGGKITGNTVSDYKGYGGGVYVYGTFTMKGGEISGNTATERYTDYPSYGGGVYVAGGTFNKTGGTIYGYTSGDSKSNTVKNSSDTVLANRGHAVYASNNSNVKRRESNAGPEVNLYFSVLGSTPSWSGAWEY
jgi:hypothetical protein